MLGEQCVRASSIIPVEVVIENGRSSVVWLDPPDYDLRLLS